MSLAHLSLVLLVVFIWGLNFIFVKLGVEQIPPLLLCTLRFLLASLPAVFFIKPPKKSAKLVISYGLIMFALQFGLVFLGMHLGMTAGMASLIMQMQVFFSILAAVLFLGEQPKLNQIMGALISFFGIALVALHFDHNISSIGFLCILGAAATWGFGNLMIKKNNNIKMLPLIFWGSLVAAVPMSILSLIFEGPSEIINTFHHITWQGVISVAYIVYASTWVGYGVWNWLLSRYPVSVIVPFTLLVPISGMLGSALILGEPFQSWKLQAALLVMLGLVINLKGSKLIALIFSPFSRLSGKQNQI